jgi:catechol 2,3-dioxygenase-like lactoylglutathione lyase family enzyme
MKLDSIAGLVCYVEDLNKTAVFYEALGFRFGKRTPNSLTVYLNWFWVEFCAQDLEDKAEFQKEAHLDPRGAGMFVCVKVEDVDAFYEGVVAKGLQPSSEPRNWSWGRREFVLRDPDGYKLVFFQKSK